MKTPSSLTGEIRQFLELLLLSEIALYVNPVVVRPLGKGITRITWCSTSGIGLLFRRKFATIDDYCGWLEANAFSAILYDGSIIQISYDFLGTDIIGHRLAYYPCPFELDRELILTEPILDVVSLYRGKDDALINLRPPIRFDYDPHAGREGHPITHLTILTSACRWAVAAPLSLGHFCRFIFRHFYPHLWDVHDFLRQWPQHLGVRTITELDEGTLHVACMR